MFVGGVDVRVEFVGNARESFPCLGSIDSGSTVGAQRGVVSGHDCEEDYKK